MYTIFSYSRVKTCYLFSYFECHLLFKITTFSLKIHQNLLLGFASVGFTGSTESLSFFSQQSPIASQAGPQAYLRKTGDPKTHSQLLSGNAYGVFSQDGQRLGCGLLSADDKDAKMQIANKMKEMEIFMFECFE